MFATVATDIYPPDNAAQDRRWVLFIPKVHLVTGLQSYRFWSETAPYRDVGHLASMKRIPGTLAILRLGVGMVAKVDGLRAGGPVTWTAHVHPTSDRATWIGISESAPDLKTGMLHAERWLRANVPAEVAGV